MKKVLVLMATYNGEKYLEEQLKSIFAQKEVIVSVLVRDDGSTDGTQKILEHWCSITPMTWYTGEHLDVKYGFYDLMVAAEGKEADYYAFSDQDDIWDEDKLICAINQLEQTDKNMPALYYCGQRLVDEKLNLISIHNMNTVRSTYARFMLNDAAGCTQVYNKSLLTKAVSYKPEYLLMHDAWLVKVCLALGGKVIVDPEPHMHYRQHANNVVGLKRDLLSKIRRGIAYINEQDVKTQMKELAIGYGEAIIPEYRQIVNEVTAYESCISYKMHLLNWKKYYFGDRGLQIVYLIKVLFNKL